MKKLVKTIQSLFKLLFFTKYKLKFPQKNTTNAVILGNGPSLKQMLSENIDFLEDKNLFALNYFALSDEFIKLKPSNYVIIDFKFFSDNANDSHTLKNRPELWSNIGKIDWKMNLFLPFEAKKHEFWKPYISKNDFLNLYFLNLTAIEGFKGFKQACYK
ncbi:MAG: hypothetical protein GX879_01780, partial [Bacteroidales bacterium]|nr:hypothetical protein [Bacteroidales bacterium]